MLLDLVEEVIPASDQAAFVLIVDQVEFICIPHFPYLSGARKRPLPAQISTQHFQGTKRWGQRYADDNASFYTVKSLQQPDTHVYHLPASKILPKPFPLVPLVVHP